MAQPCLLALDLGTTTCRCLAFDRRGTPLVAVTDEVRLEHPEPGLAIVHAEAWWAAACRVLSQAREQLHRLGLEPIALGLAGLQHAMVPVSEAGDVLAPSMLWMDQRCRAEVDWLNTEAREALEAVFGPGARASTTPSLPKLRWLSIHEPDLLARARHLLLPKDWIRYRLTGTTATDASDAGGTMLYDPQTGDWAPSLVALAGIRQDQLPPILPSETVVGRVTAAAAAATGLSSGLPVVVGAGDVQATVLGTGGGCPDRMLIYMGTAAWIRRHGLRNRARVMATATTGAALRWLRDLLAGPSESLSYDALTSDADDVPPGAEGVIFLPHLCGERGPVPNPDARGTLTGLSLRHGRGHLARAVLEGTCCHLRWMLEDAQGDLPTEIYVAGGAAHSPLWMQILAATLGRTVHTPQVVEAGALGAAMLAAIGVGLYGDREQAVAAMVHPGASYAPNAEWTAQYEQIYRAWRQAEACWGA